MIKRIAMLAAGAVLLAGATTANAQNAIDAGDDNFRVVSSANPFRIILTKAQLLSNDRLGSNPRAFFRNFRRTNPSAFFPNSKIPAPNSFGIANLKLRADGRIAVWFKRNFVGKTRFVYFIKRNQEVSKGNVRFNVVSPS